MLLVAAVLCCGGDFATTSTACSKRSHASARSSDVSFFGCIMRTPPLRPLPTPLLVQLGRIATTTAYIEQEFVLWASAIYSQRTGGRPIEHLRMSFQRLLSKWHTEAVHHLDSDTVTKFINPLRNELNKRWPVRNAFIHGQWRSKGRLFHVDWWEQTKQTGLRHYSYTVPLSDIRAHADAFDRLLVRLYRYHDQPPSPSPRKSGAHRSQVVRRSGTKRK